MKVIRCTVSIVSHQQAALVGRLLEDLERYAEARHGLEVVVVVNVPEDEGPLEIRRSFPITILRNTNPKGFGANHNSAFRVSKGDVFVVANPDLHLVDDPFPALLEGVADPEVGIGAPVVLGPSGNVEDSARQFPSILSLARRWALGKRKLDYTIEGTSTPVDWVAGMFMVFRREVYEALGGFDERYFLYFEDVDICRRVHEMGLAVKVQPEARVIHNARRASHRKLRYFLWHVGGLCRYFMTAPSRGPRGRARV
jgi:GT2 family glycosyltransferase